MAQNKPNKNQEDGSPRQRKMTMNDKRRANRSNGYQGVSDIIFNGYAPPPKQ